jgi:hypothetical protein
MSDLLSALRERLAEAMAEATAKAKTAAENFESATTARDIAQIDATSFETLFRPIASRADIKRVEVAPFLVREREVVQQRLKSAKAEVVRAGNAAKAAQKALLDLTLADEQIGKSK